jgi:hypothetical protein
MKIHLLKVAAASCLERSPWVRLDGLKTADWAVVTEYVDMLKPLQAITKRLEARGNSGRFSAVAKVISGLSTFSITTGNASKST